MRPCALGLAHVRGEALGLGQRQRLGEALGEVLVRVPRMPGRERHHHVHALAAREHREARQADVGEPVVDVLRRLLHRRRSRARRRDRGRTPSGRAPRRRSPCCPSRGTRSCPSARRRAGPPRRRRRDSPRRRRPSRRSARGGRAAPNEPLSCFWKKHFFARPCGQRTRLTGRPAAHGSISGATACVVVGELALGLAALGEDHPVAAGDLDRLLLGRFGAAFSGTTSFAFLSSRSPTKLPWRTLPSRGELGEGDLGHQLRARARSPRGFPRARPRPARSCARSWRICAARSRSVSALNPVPTLPL